MQGKIYYSYSHRMWVYHDGIHEWLFYSEATANRHKVNVENAG